jgi:hypothetical protein
MSTLCLSEPRSVLCGLARQIDQLVYELYGLTDEEIRIVEPEAGT